MPYHLRPVLTRVASGGATNPGSITKVLRLTFACLFSFSLILSACASPRTPDAALSSPSASPTPSLEASPSAIPQATPPRTSGPTPSPRLDAETMRLTGGNCTGTDKPKLGVLPMSPLDFGIVIPYGLAVGNHVTPIDHQYFTPRDRASALDAYPVYAMADATVAYIQARRFPTGPKTVEYRIHFAMSCKLIYYYDLVTVLSPKLQEAFDQKRMGFPVKAGEVIGRIGGQTLDFALWDMDVTLPGFVLPSSYSYEPWKVHTVDPLPYYTDELKALVLSRSVRTVAPVSGKIDYDVDGRLVGNWFVEGTNGYQGLVQSTYWRGHLAIAPNHYDPTRTIVSFGDFNGTEAQFTIRGNLPVPEEVSVESGLVRYDLVSWDYLAPNGARWDRQSLIKGPRLQESGPIRGCLIVQLLEVRKLQAQAFPGKTCAEIPGFDNGSRIYVR